MFTKLVRLSYGFALLLILHACASSKPQKEVAHDLPKALSEFRAAWVATVANINWPSKRGLSTEEQKKEALELLDFLKAHNFNAVVFQVRPQADALYQSSLEPWSYYLTGVQGQAPNPYYDPLEFWTEAAHDRGLEMHVWLNPYRAHHVSGGEVSDRSLVKRRPELVVKLKEGYWWFDPAKKGTQDHSTAVVMDLVKRYDIDGVHFDDYFYPYPSYNGNEDFPDNDSWTEYTQNGGKLSRADWRREAVNTFIKRLYTEIKAEKKHVKFGLSPFGMYRPGHPASIQGFDQYQELYADARLWLNKGWVDYFTPQLYWPISRIAQSYPVLLGWWKDENTKGRHLWPGISVGRDTSINTVNETLNQIMISRGMTPESMGVVHWNIASVMKNPNMAKALLDGPYKKEALVPSSAWLNKKAPEKPEITTEQKEDVVKINWSHPKEKEVFRWVVYYQYGKVWNYSIVNRNDRTMEIKLWTGDGTRKTPLNRIAVSAVDRTGNESRYTEVVLTKNREDNPANVKTIGKR